MGAAEVVQARVVEWGCPKMVDLGSSRYVASRLTVDVVRAVTGSLSGRERGNCPA